MGREFRILVQYSRSLRPEKHCRHQKIAGAEAAVEPFRIAKATGKSDEALTPGAQIFCSALWPLAPGTAPSVRRAILPGRIAFAGYNRLAI